MMHVKVSQHFDLVCFHIFVGLVVSHSVQPMDLDKFQWITLTTIWCFSSQACQGHCNLSRSCTFCIMVSRTFIYVKLHVIGPRSFPVSCKDKRGSNFVKSVSSKNCSWRSHLFMLSFVLPLFFLFLLNFCGVTHLTTCTPSLLPAAFPCTLTNTAIFVMEAPYKTY